MKRTEPGECCESVDSWQPISGGDIKILVALLVVRSVSDQSSDK